MANVVLASDPSGQPIALKVLKSSRIGSGLPRFRREFRALSRLRHPNVIRVDAYGDIHGHPYIAMEYVEGTDLHHIIHGFKELSLEERWRQCERILVDLCRALAYIHRRGFIHRDLKPSNVLMNAEGVCKLTDFGIVKDLDPNADAMVSTTLVGTWAYASPEQIAGLPIDHRSDLYSLGVILFAMLTGRRPFVAKDLAGYLELHRTHRAPGPSDVEPTVPPHLDAICRRLLKKLPRDRYRSAREILYRFEQIEPEPGIGRGRPEVLELPLVGRVAEDAALRERVAGLSRGEGGVLFIEGGAGCGSSRMLSVLAAHAEMTGVAVHAEEVRAQDAPHAVLCRVGRRLGLRDLEVSWPRERLVERLIEAIQAALEDGPLVLLIDELHGATASLVEALHLLLRQIRQMQQAQAGISGQPGLPLLIGFGLCADRLPPRLILLREQGDRMGLGPLNRADVEGLLEELVAPGRLTQALADRLHRETEGNPYFLHHYVQGLVARGLLQRNLGVRPGKAAGASGKPPTRMTEWRISADLDEIMAGHIDIPPAVRSYVLARTEFTGGLDRSVLEVLAVHRQPVGLDTVLEVLDLDEEPVADALARLQEAGILRLRGNGEQLRLEFRNRCFGDVIYRRLEEERRAGLHRRLAEVLEARFAHASGAAELVGEHYRRAGDAGKAFQYLSNAARRALDRGLAEAALDLAARAAPSEEAARVDLGVAPYNQIKLQLLEVRAEIARIRGEWAEARELLESAIGSASKAKEEVAGLRLQLRLAQALRRQGHLLRAEEIAATALLQARERHERDLVMEGLSTLSTLAWSRGDLERCEALAQEGLILATGRARAGLLLSLTAVQASRGQLASAAAGLWEAEALCREPRDKPVRALILANLAEVLLGQGEVQAAWDRAEEGMAVAQELGHRLAESAIRRVRGMLLLQLGQPERAREELQEAIHQSQGGQPQELCAAQFYLARACAEAGLLPEAAAQLAAAREGLSSGDPERYRIAIDVEEALVAALSGRSEEARQRLEAVGNQPALLPALRRAEVTLDIARCWAALNEVGAAISTVRAVIHLSGLRGFRLLVVEALAFAAWFTPDAAERERLGQQMNESMRALALVEPWQSGLRQRLGLGG